MKKGTFIWTLLLAGVSLVPLFSQEAAADTARMEAYTAMAGRDAAHEHSLVFTKAADEADFWNDQRVFEQGLLEHNPEFYRTYLQGKKVAYLSHRESCDSRCNHGDYYFRQASFYLQHDSGKNGALLTLIKSNQTGVWEVSYTAGNRH